MYMIICHLYIISGERFSNLLTTPLFKLGHLFPYCWVLESYLYTLATSPWLAMCSASISPQSMVSLFIFLSVFQRKEGFNCDEVQFIFFFHFLVVLLCHIQKVWLIQHHKDIFLCFVLEHLLFYIEHSGLWYILGSCFIIEHLCCCKSFLSGFLFQSLPSNSGFPGVTSHKEPTCQCRRHKRCGFDPWVSKIPWRRAWEPTSIFLSGESHGQRSLVGYSPWGHTETT